MMIDVILGEAKDLTVGMRVCFNQLKINEAKMIRDGGAKRETHWWRQRIRNGPIYRECYFSI